MRQVFIADSKLGLHHEGDLAAKTKREAEALVPWAAVVIKVEGGWHAWESVGDYKTWMAQK